MIYLAADHRGFLLKEEIKQWLDDWGEPYEDMGNQKADPKDDYPDYVLKVAEKIQQGGKGIAVCGSGVGVDIVANKVKGIRSVLGYNQDEVKHAVECENVNMLSLGADYVSEGQAKEMVKVFLHSQPSKEVRHLRRIDKIKKIEGGSLC